MPFPRPTLAPLALLFVVAHAAEPAPEKPASSPAAAAALADNPELVRLHAEDQADRQPPPGKAIDWSVVGPRDEARLARTKQIYAAGELHTGADYYHAALVLQHAHEPDDFLLAHELCVVALSKGYAPALWLAAASEDRFLRSIGRPQRFGTQYLTEGDGPTFLQETDERVTDHHRRAMKVPSLAKSKARASQLDQGRQVALAPRPDAPPLTQEIFTTADQAGAALAKIRQFSARTNDEIFTLVRACRELCLRFDDPQVQATAMSLAGSRWFRLTPEQHAQLAGWDPAQGEDNPAFSVDQRASIATQRAYGLAAARAKSAPATYTAALFDEAFRVAAKLHGSPVAREFLVDAALGAPAELALPRLREISPADPLIAEGIRQLERVGQPLDLELETLDGARVRTADLRGKVVLIHFFAARFAPSVALAAELKQLAARHGASNFALVGIGTDKDRAAVARAAEQHAITWPVHHDRAGPAGLVHDFRAQILPYFLLLDRAGKLRHRGIQPNTPDTLQQIDALLAER